eukprot:NODE_2790_length_991_cov_76.778935_g2770_i0.p1 GENE.NODE_2790_length_991_cov_76.778935_g2770_i0~~NODE_2790_length_991_cov_76.778935_g2770_i0.p1  ORF type:complete len:291 (-),score=11.49 NODE_2790_length_991_cov_76.778935_g2770_i0:44-916(-)
MPRARHRATYSARNWNKPMSRATIRRLCGLPFWVLLYIWIVYIVSDPDSPFTTLADLFDVYHWLKTYTPGLTGKAQCVRRHRIKWLAVALRSEISNVVNADLPSFPPPIPAQWKYVVDTFPLRINKPTQSPLARLTYSGKYKANVLKFQVMIDADGVMVHLSGPYWGCRSDTRLWKTYTPCCQSTATDPTPVELQHGVMGDGAYRTCRHCVWPHRKKALQSLTVQEAAYNVVFDHYRARVEHTIGTLHEFQFIHTWKNRCNGWELRAAGVHAIAAAKNIELKAANRYNRV